MEISLSSAALRLIIVRTLYLNMVFRNSQPFVFAEYKCGHIGIAESSRHPPDRSLGSSAQISNSSPRLLRIDHYVINDYVLGA